MIYDQNGEMVGNITSSSSVNDEGDIVISYDGKNVRKINIKATNPIGEGTIELKHIKTITENKDEIRNASELKTTVSAKYNTDVIQDAESTIKLENTITESKLEINRDTLSTVIANNVEIKAVLLSNNEKYDLYTNPQISIQLPDEVENITINNIDILYENELSLSNYEVNGKTINITLTGSQKQYKEEVEKNSIKAFILKCKIQILEEVLENK